MSELVAAARLRRDPRLHRARRRVRRRSAFCAGRAWLPGGICRAQCRVGSGRGRGKRLCRGRTVTLGSEDWTRSSARILPTSSTAAGRALSWLTHAIVEPWTSAQLASSSLHRRAPRSAASGWRRARSARARVSGRPRLLRFLALLLRRTRWIVAALLLGAVLVVHGAASPKAAARSSGSPFR